PARRLAHGSRRRGRKREGRLPHRVDGRDVDGGRVRVGRFARLRGPAVVPPAQAGARSALPLDGSWSAPRRRDHGRRRDLYAGTGRRPDDLPPRRTVGPAAGRAGSPAVTTRYQPAAPGQAALCWNQVLEAATCGTPTSRPPWSSTRTRTPAWTARSRKDG